MQERPLLGCGRCWRCAIRYCFRKSMSPRGSSSTSCCVIRHICFLLKQMSTGQSKVSYDVTNPSFMDLSFWDFRQMLREPGKEVVDCSVCGSSGHAISGDLNLLENLILNSDARYIIIVEKHAIFQRLTEDQFFHQIPTILITAKGYPDMATRFLLHRISRAFPDLPILALVDWNPAGLAILCTFKFGSVGMGLEAYRYACNVKWLGLRGHDLHMLPDQSLVPLKPKDLQIAQSLMSSGILQENYKEEVALMVQSGRRAEIEALYFHGYDYLGKYIAKKIVQSDYI